MKAKTKQAKPSQRSIRAAQAVLNQAAAATIPAQAETTTTSVPSAIRSVMLLVGGTKDKPVHENIALIPAVKPEELTAYGVGKKRILSGLACNLLAGTAFDPDFRNKTGKVWGDRALKQEKSSWFRLLESGYSAPKLREVWAEGIKGRSRYDAPTIIALDKMVRQHKAADGSMPRRISPMERFAITLKDIVADTKLSDAEKLRSILYHVNQQIEDNGEKTTPTVQGGTVPAQATGTHG